MRNRAQITTTRPIKPAVYGVKKDGYFINENFLKKTHENPKKFTQRKKAIVNKILNIDTSYIEENEIDLKEQKQPGNFFLRNRQRKDKNNNPIPYTYKPGPERLTRASLREKIPSQQKKNFSESSMNEFRQGAKKPTLTDPDVERDYEDDLNRTKSEILKTKKIQELRKLAKRMGGPENLARHYKLDAKEIGQVFAPYVKNRRKIDGAIRSKSPSSMIPSSPGRINLPNRSKLRPRVYTIGRKIGEEEKKNQKKIFYPLPPDMRI